MIHVSLHTFNTFFQRTYVYVSLRSTQMQLTLIIELWLSGCGMQKLTLKPFCKAQMRMY